MLYITSTLLVGMHGSFFCWFLDSKYNLQENDAELGEIFAMSA
jgi:hypothetical protein